MYGLYLLALFLLLGVDAKRPSDHGKANKNDELSLEATLRNNGNSSTIIANLVLTPKQTRDLEIALNDVVRKLLGPQRGQLSLRTAEDGNTGFVHTLRVISGAIRSQIVRLLEGFGLIRSSKPESVDNTQRNNLGLKAAVYHELLRVPLTLSSVCQTLQNQMRNHFRKRDYAKMGYKSAKFEFRMDYGTSTDQLKFSAMMGAMDAYSRNFYNCLQQRKSTSFDVIRALGNLTNSSPEVTGRRLRNHLERPIPRSPGRRNGGYTEFHAFACRAFGQDSRADYYNCLVEIKRIDTCLRKKPSDSSKSAEPARKSARDFRRTIKSLDDTCKTADQGMPDVVGCGLKAKAARVNSLPYIVDFFMGDLDKSPALGRMANDVGAIITKSSVGSEALNEVVALIEIYKQGAEKKARLLKAARRNYHRTSVFSRISAILAKYKQHIYDVTHTTVAHVHNVMTTVEKILVESASTLVGQDLSANMQTMKCWSGFVDSICTDWSHNHSQFPMIPQAEVALDQFAKDGKRSRPRGLVKVRNQVGFIKSPHEEPLNKFIGSMKRLGQRNQPRRSTALMSLANTFLLATMFYECISLLAGAIYREDSGSMFSSNSAESVESDRWQSPRDRRSTSPIDEEDLQSQNRVDHQEGPLSPTSETDNVIPTTASPNFEGLQESVGISYLDIPEDLDRDPTPASSEFIIHE